MDAPEIYKILSVLFLQIVATGQLGNDERVFGLDDFTDLETIVGTLQSSIESILEGRN